VDKLYTKDKAFSRRFDPVSIPTLSAEQVKKVLQGYEGFFHKKYGSWLDLPTPVIDLLVGQRLEAQSTLQGGASPSWQVKPLT